MVPCTGRGHPAPWRPGQQPGVDQERFGHLLDGLAFFADGHRQRAQPDWATGKTPAQRVQDGPVEPVEADVVDLVDGQRGTRDVAVDHSVRTDLGEVTHPPQQTVRNPRCATRSSGDLLRAVRAQGYAEQPGRTDEDLLELGWLVEVETAGEPEPVAQRAWQQTGPGGGSDQGKRRKVERDGGRAGP